MTADGGDDGPRRRAVVATTTFLFTDIEGSTRLAREAGAAWAGLLDAHRRILRAAVADHDGTEVDTQGDSFFVVFPTPRQAVAAAVDAQRALAAHPWPPQLPVRVRMGIHTGEVATTGGSYVGVEVHRAARVGALGHGGQVVLSEATATLVRDTLPDDTGLRDLGEHRLKDFDRPERLYQLDVAGLPSRFPPLASGRSPRLEPGTAGGAALGAAPSTALVGRGAELAELRALVLGGERLVTLTGPGGIGKTRLALQLAAELTSELPDGVAVASLAALQDPDLVAATVAQALRVRQDGREDALDALKAHLAPRRMLLVLDNFEQVMPATPVVTALLDAAPGLHVVVTSREALRVRAEHEVPVASLPVADAVELFAQRAAAVAHGFAVDDANRPTLERIVAALEGVPLAIELAAARVRILPLEAILGRLDRSLDFLRGGARDLPERQRALRTTLDWSYELLDDDDRRLFARLGVFAGSFSLLAAEAVADLDGDLDVLAGLTSLVDKSLLRAEPAMGEARFRMLVMVRDHAREKLEASGEREAVARRHADHYAWLSRELGVALRGPEQAACVARVVAGGGAGDIDNLRAAVRWYLDHGELEHVARIVWSLWLLGWITGQLEVHRRWARDALATGVPLSPKARARLLTVAGLMEMWSGLYAPSLPALAEAVALARPLGDRDLLANALLGLSLVAASVEGVPVGLAHAEEANDLFAASGDGWGLSISSSVLTWFLVATDDFEGRGPVFERALVVAEDLADELSRAMVETNVGEQRLHVGDHAEAGRLLASSLRRHRGIRAHYPTAYAVDGVARLAAAGGRPRTAAVLLGAADAMRRAIGVPVEAVHVPRRERLVAALRDEMGATAFDQARAEGHRLGYHEAVDAALAAAADAARR